MKQQVFSLTDILSVYLQKLLFIERNIRPAFLHCRYELNSRALENEMLRYLDFCDDNAMRIQRMFNYVMKEPGDRHNEVFEKMTAEIRNTIKFADNDVLRQVMFIGCVESLISYKIAGYRTAYLLSAQQEFDAVADLTQICLEGEYAALKGFSDLAIRKLNEAQTAS